MANIFGTNAVTIYVDEEAYDLPMPIRGGRNETFVKETKTWIDITNEIQERIKGYRLEAKYEYDFIENDDLENLITIYNAVSKSSNIKLKFQTLPRHYPVIIEEFDRGLGSGYTFKDSAMIHFVGKTLVKNFPNPDLVYTILPMRGKGAVVNTLTKQWINK
jgi:hypothetical protein